MDFQLFRQHMLFLVRLLFFFSHVNYTFKKVGFETSIVISGKFQTCCLKFFLNLWFRSRFLLINILSYLIVLFADFFLSTQYINYDIKNNINCIVRIDWNIYFARFLKLYALFIVIADFKMKIPPYWLKWLLIFFIYKYFIGPISSILF